MQNDKACALLLTSGEQRTELTPYPGIKVECYGTLAEITQNSFVGSRQDSFLSGYGRPNS